MNIEQAFIGAGYIFVVLHQSLRKNFERKFTLLGWAVSVEKRCTYYIMLLTNIYSSDKLLVITYNFKNNIQKLGFLIS